VAAEPFNVPNLKPQVGWRMNEQDMKNVRLLMADRRETSVSGLLRALVEQEAAAARRRWLAAAKRIADMEEKADG
jgi:predicted RNA-binding protein